MDDLDRRLVDLLREDGRRPVADLAEAAGISRAGAYQRLARLRESGVIEGFTVRANPRLLGLAVTALIIVNVDQRDWRRLRRDLGALPGVTYVALTTGAFDFLLLVRVRDVTTLRDVVLEAILGIDGVRSSQTIFVLDEDVLD